MRSLSLFPWLRRTSSPAQSPARRHLQFEALEDRLVPSGQPLSNFLALHSNPTAQVKTYLDFDGGFDPSWVNVNPDGTTTMGAAWDVWSMDADRTTYNDQELQMIRDIWRNVADDYSPFNVDVTTVDPLDFSAGKNIQVAMAYGGGGQAQDTDFFHPNGQITVGCGGGANARQMADVISQEVGHVFGLNHHPEFAPDGSIIWEYGTNNFSPLKAPIMGYPGYAARSLWWHGMDAGGQDQDDMAEIAGFVGFRSDDHSDSRSQATALASIGQLSRGVIGQTADVDWFSFTVTGGAYVLHADPVENLDARLELRDAQGNLITSVDDPNSTGAVIIQSLAAGTYYLKVASHGDYGDVGQYTVGIEEARLRVISSDASPGRVRITFNNPVDPATFAIGDILVLNRANGVVPGVSLVSVAGTGNRTWEITFTQPATGGYRLEVGPDVRDIWGNAMDQDGDWVFSGLMQDKFVLEDFVAPRVLGTTVSQELWLTIPVGPVLRSFRTMPTLLVTFSEKMDLASFTSANIQISGPSGPVNLGPVGLVSGGGNSWTYAITLPSLPGNYPVTLGPGLTDMFGNKMDQDGDGRLGEAADDRYVTTARLDLIAQRPIQINLDKLERWLRGGRKPFDLPRLPMEHTRVLFREVFGSGLSPKEMTATLDKYFAELQARAPKTKDALVALLLPGRDQLVRRSDQGELWQKQRL